MIELIIAFITGVISPITVVLLKNWLDKKKKPDMVADTLELGEVVTHKIEEIREEISADRVWLIQFHNGGHFYPTGKSMAKFSMIYETVNIKVSSIQSNFQNIPVSLFSKSINELLKNDIIEITDFKDETIATFGLKYIGEEYGCKSGYLFAIKTIDDKFIGIIGVDYTGEKTTLNDDIINRLSIKATSIGGVLMNHLKS
jgi:hypothetical protein